MIRSEFKAKYLTNAFYWVNKSNYLILQQIFQEFGILCHTGEGIINWHDKFHNLCTFPPDKWNDFEYYQKVDCWFPNCSYGEPKNYTDMLIDYIGLPTESEAGNE
jgi:hypothetical protein